MRVGDLVIGTERMREHKAIGIRGKILLVDTSKGLPYLVEFEKPMGGHHGHSDKVKGKMGHCWWCYEHYIKLVSSNVWQGKKPTGGR